MYYYISDAYKTVKYKDVLKLTRISSNCQSTTCFFFVICHLSAISNTFVFFLCCLRKPETIVYQRQLVLRVPCICCSARNHGMFLLSLQAKMKKLVKRMMMEAITRKDVMKVLLWGVTMASSCCKMKKKRAMIMTMMTTKMTKVSRGGCIL